VVSIPRAGCCDVTVVEAVVGDPKGLGDWARLFKK